MSFRLVANATPASYLALITRAVASGLALHQFKGTAMRDRMGQL
jgi:hypothetical protein